MKALLDFLDRHEAGHVVLEEGSRNCGETQGTVAQDRRRKLPAVLSKHEHRFADGSQPSPDAFHLFRSKLA